jgi:hypothetical protein
MNKIKALSGVLKSISSPKIFCISVQRTGTTSVGQFFKQHNFRVATWAVSRKNNWTLKWFKGDFDSIFRSKDFRLNQVFEDDPWWCSDFYKILFNKFPRAKFIMFERDPDSWFNSMVKHSGGKSLGNTHLHASIYHRLEDFYSAGYKEENKYTSKLDNLLPLGEQNRKHYIDFYRLRNNEIKDYFERFGKERIVMVQLEDPNKWQKVGLFFDINVEPNYKVHSNKSQ